MESEHPGEGDGGEKDEGGRKGGMGVGGCSGGDGCNKRGAGAKMGQEGQKKKKERDGVLLSGMNSWWCLSCV